MELINVLAKTIKQVDCEESPGIDYFPYGGVKESCQMISRTSIDSLDSTISSASDNSVGGIIMWYNKKIHFLPVGFYKSFPYLERLEAYSCSIKAISKDNFKNLMAECLMVSIICKQFP